MINKALKHGIESFQPHEVLELYLFTLLPRVDTNHIAHALLQKFGTFEGVCNAPLEELMKVKGIGRKTAQQIKLFPYFVKAYQLSAHGDKISFRSINEIGEYCVKLYTGVVNEIMYVLCLDASNKLVNQVLVAEGTPSEVYVEPRQIVEHVIHTTTCSVVLCHNHPGGTLMPSQNDIETNKRIKVALEAIGIRLLDHIIVAKGNYITFNNHKF
ncbi:MAG: DNA repair protein RadC [Eubacteriales bacterium]|nr:DNA repair protein RadC [Eubacteriales bacterium]